MSIKVQSKYSDTKLHNIRCLMVDNTEKFRLVDSNGKLLYAKGKINFNLNNSFTDSNNVVHDFPTGGFGWWPNRPKELFAFYAEEGFYQKTGGNDQFRKYTKLLSEMMIFYSSESPAPWWCKPVSFDGWYLSKTKQTGEHKINSIEDVYRYTNLFNYRTDTSLPEITLYARWKVPTVTLQICNIKLKGSSSSLSYYDDQKKKWLKTSDAYATKYTITYGTDIRKYISSRIKDVKYVTWAYSELDGTSYQTSLRGGPQKFLGWFINNSHNIYPEYFFRTHGAGYFWDEGFTIPDKVPEHVSNSDQTYAMSVKIIYVIPYFEPLIVVPKFKVWSNNSYHTVGGYYFKNPSTTHLVEILMKVEDENDWIPAYSWKFKPSDPCYAESKPKELVPVNQNTNANLKRIFYSCTYVLTVKKIF